MEKSLRVRGRKCTIVLAAYGEFFRSGRASISDRLEIRAFRAEEFEELYAIDQACYPPPIAYSRPVLLIFLYGPGTKTFVAAWEGQIVGFVTVQKKTAQRGHIITLDVLESYRRRGIGHGLLETGEEWLASQGVLSVNLETAVGNLTGIEFWKANGYAIQRRIGHYYGGRADAFLMKKALVQVGPRKS
ncbi:MAG TPA: N-acetyltransferase [Candidatus Acidoferrales bacterium]